MNMKKRVLINMLALSVLAGTLTGCGNAGQKGVKLDPNNPISLTIWHYYNGIPQAAFDALTEEFNATVGKEQGIYVKGYSQGSVFDLEKAITDSVDGVVGAEKMPDIFSSYADTAYATQKKVGLADLTQYFTEDELAAYVDSYVEEGYFNNDGALYLFPVAKSTEIMMINKTDWEPFAEQTGAEVEDLNTMEGVIKVAQLYYEWTDAQTPDVPDDGKAFYGRDSMSNYFIIGMKQMGTDLFEVNDGNVTLNTDKDKIRRLWDNYYVPYMKGYFAAFGKFRSDDVKTGDILAYTGSAASSMYFPDNLEGENDVYPIDFIVCDAPIMDGGEHYKVQQGAGMAVTKSDEQHEYAASVFLKWFTQKEENLRFVCESAYLPVLKESNTVEALDKVIEDNAIEINPKAYACLESTMNNFDNITFYTSACFDNGYSARTVLDYNLSDKAQADKEAVELAVSAGTPREEAVAPYITDEAFDAWYDSFCQALNDAVK